MKEEERKKTIGVVHEVEEDGNYKRNLKTRLRNIHSII